MSSNWQNVGTIRGPQGEQGPQGEPGIGEIGPAGPPGLTWRGAWASNTAYAINDAVSHNGASYRAVVAHNSGAGTGLQPPHSNWAVIAERGQPGQDGQPGADGQTGAAGPAGLTWRGTWASGQTYAVNDAVTYDGSSFRAQVAHTSSGSGATGPPPTANWLVIAERGQQGLQGIEGPPGAGVYIRGTFRDVTSLPAPGVSPGPTDFVRYQGEIYQWIGSTWVLQPGQPGHAYLDLDGNLWVWTGSSS